MMQESAITISGLTPSARYCLCRPEDFSTGCFADTLTIASCEPEIKKILAACVSVALVDFKILCTAAGKQLVVTFRENSTITYTAANCLATKHHAVFCLPRCLTMTLTGDCPVKTVRLFIEDFTVMNISPRAVGATSLIAAVPEFRAHRSDGDNSLRCDIKIRQPS